MEKWQLKQLQGLPLEVKIEKTKLRIKEWYDYWDGQVYVSFSGGKDSTVLLHIVRELYPDVPAVFVDTGLEYPEIRDFVKSKLNIIWIKPMIYNRKTKTYKPITFNQVVEQYGYPVISKDVSGKVKRNRSKPNGCTKDMFDGVGRYEKSIYNVSKWKFLLDSPFKISDECCEVMKKRPFRKFERESGLLPITGTMASESRQRKNKWLQYGCNAFSNTHPISNPMSFWTDQDVLEYLYKFKIPYASVYGDIIEDENGLLKTTGEKRTGCMFCMFGCHLEKEPNRFQRMKITHPKIYDYCIRPIEQGGLGLGKVLDYINVKY